VTGRQLLVLQAAAARHHLNTLVIPQLHPLLAMTDSAYFSLTFLIRLANYIQCFEFSLLMRG